MAVREIMSRASRWNRAGARPKYGVGIDNVTTSVLAEIDAADGVPSPRFALRANGRPELEVARP